MSTNLPIQCDMTTFAQLSTAGQLTIPLAIRKELGLSAGDPLQISMVGGRMIVEPVIVTPKSFNELDAVLDQVEADHGKAIERLAEL